MIALGKKLLAISAFFALLGLIADGFLYVSLLRMVKERDTIRQEEQGLVAEKQALDRLSERISDAKKEMGSIDAMLPATLGDYVAFANDLSAVATVSGVTLTFSAAKDPKTQKKDAFSYRVEALSFEVGGSYSNILQFFQNIYQLPFFFQIDTLAINKNALGPGIQASGQMILYMQ